eukprot:6726824-Prymnesium_polylepis.1
MLATRSRARRRGMRCRRARTMDWVALPVRAGPCQPRSATYAPTIIILSLRAAQRDGGPVLVVQRATIRPRPAGGLDAVEPHEPRPPAAHGRAGRAVAC